MLTHRNTVIQRLLRHLQGVWKLKRRLGTQGHMHGVAHFQTWKEGVLHYQEQGYADFGSGKPFFAYRAYAYVYDQGTVAVHFWDRERKQPAGLLHTLHFQNAKHGGQILAATGTHQCVNDVYKARYTFVSPAHFQLIYRVQGPHKDYTMQTHFSKGDVGMRFP